MRGEVGEKNEGEVGAAGFESGKGGISRLWFLKDESPKEKKGRNSREGDEKWWGSLALWFWERKIQGPQVIKIQKQ